MICSDWIFLMYCLHWCLQIQGLPYVRHWMKYRFKNDTSQDTAEPISHDGGISDKKIFKKEPNTTQAVRIKEKSYEKQSFKQQGLRKRRRKRCPRCWSRFCLPPVERIMIEQVFSCSLWRMPHQSSLICHEGTSACVEDPILEKVYPEGLQPVGDACWSREELCCPYWVSILSPGTSSIWSILFRGTTLHLVVFHMFW